MKKLILPAALLLALPSFAEGPWNAGLILGRQGFAKTETSITMQGTTQKLTTEPEVNTSFGLQAGYRIWDLAKSDITLNGAVRFKSSTKAKLTFDETGMNQIIKKVDMDVQSYALGGQWNWHKAVDFGFGLEVRSTKITYANLSATTVRPWLNGYVGKTFDTAGSLKPYVALNLGTALSHDMPARYDELTKDSGKRQQLKSADALAEISLQFGVRF